MTPKDPALELIRRPNEDDVDGALALVAPDTRLVGPVERRVESRAGGARDRP